MDKKEREAVLTGAASPWTLPAPVANAIMACPTVAAGPSTLVGMAWQEPGDEIWATCGSVGGSWGFATLVATGRQPSMVQDSTKTLHMTFANTFGGNEEIYYVKKPYGGTWTLPVNVSHTSGKSANPRIALGPSNAPYIVWDDTAPGYKVIYIGWKGPAGWCNYPIPSAKGYTSALAVGAGGNIYVAFADGVPSQVYVVRSNGAPNAHAWLLPDAVTDDEANAYSEPDVVVGLTMAHVVFTRTYPAGNSKACLVQGTAGVWSDVYAWSAWDATASMPRVVHTANGWVVACYLESNANGTRVMARKKPASTEVWNWYPFEVVVDQPPVVPAALTVDSTSRPHAMWGQPTTALLARRTNVYP